ncbi:Hypothetical predicted protein [Drosophila guanche]|uniref:Protein javelin n=2 Tax=Drosophila guanche TaxID=7266 RepID=A0A3B0KMY4_DROGU|nr:Hypothetical predicted protein [Drosophila guanche]
MEKGRHNTTPQQKEEQQTSDRTKYLSNFQLARSPSRHILPVKIGSGQSHSLCYGGTMGNGYFRTSQTSSSSRQREKRGKESYSYQHNYVDRVRIEDTNGGHQHSHSHYHNSSSSSTTNGAGVHDPRCPQGLRAAAAGWRHTHKSVSHLDLATSCHEAAGNGIGRHTQNHSHVHHSHSHSHPHHLQHAHHSHHPHAQPHWTQCRVGLGGGGGGGTTAGGGGGGPGSGQLRNARSLDYTQLEREENALDIAEFYWRFDAEAPLDHGDSYAVLPINDNFEAEAAAEEGGEPTTPVNGGTAPAATATATATLLDLLGSESCSLRRSRSLAVIREETFSDLQIGSANSSRRRSQLIPRARLVNRGFFRESPRLNAKQQQQQQTTSSTIEQPLETPPADDTQSHRSSNNSGTCDSHQQQQKQQQQQQKQQQNTKRGHLARGESRDFDLYYDNLKRLDALALGLSEQLHPWHNDKSDLESLNSDYFKNSLHQNHLEQQQQQQQQQQQGPSSLEFEALEQAAVNLLKERPRIYQSRRQQQHQHQRNHHHHQCHLQRHLQQDTGAESCPEHSQSSIFPETTTSNSDDQTDSPSLSEQEYDLTHIEEIYQQQGGVNGGTGTGSNGGVEESYEIISLTTTARTTRFGESSDQEEYQEGDDTAAEESRSSLTPTSGQIPASDSDCTLKRGLHGDQLIAYDSVYLSSEDSSDCTLIGESCESFEQRTFTSCGESGELETRSLLHISIEDTVYEPQAKQHKKGATEEQQPLLTTAKVEAQIFTQVLKVEHTPQNKPKILAVVEKRKLKQEEAQVKQQQPQTDSFVVVSNLQENQYHSLPDVNIGVSLKVCESIDKELRSSYNLQRQQQRRDSKRGGQVVTRAETYDSIRRFGRAHQKARQKEHQEREREREREAAAAAAAGGGGAPAGEKEKQQQETQRQEKVTKITKEIVAPEEPQRQEELEEEEPPLPPPPPPLTEEEKQQQEEEEEEPQEEPELVSIVHVEKPKEAPVIEVANFSQLIERRAQEIRERKDHDQNVSFTGIQEQQQQQQQQKEAEQEEETLFHIIVTDAQNNIIQKEAIHEEHSSQRPRNVRRSQSSSSGSKPPERRVLHSGGAPIYKARPIKVLAAGHSESTFGRGKMSRPQILHVVDGGATEGSLRRRSSARSIASTVSSGGAGGGGGAVATEYLQKVDAVRCYWQKLAGNEPETDKGVEEPPQEQGVHFQLGGKTTALQQQQLHQQQPQPQPHSNDFCSMMPPPSIEIVELGEGSQKATIVSAGPDPDADEDEDQDGAQFDHIRYKVLKSQQLIRSNILHHSTRNKKEAQFDGLIQYLQDYSFQELLSNNNVVIVEPVRTKIERPLQVGGNKTGVAAAAAAAAGPPKPPRVIHASGSQPRRNTLRQRQMGGGGGGGGGAAARRHFFYQPVRVNRELYEDELPDPDTVRNVRRFFEQNVMPSPGQGLLVRSQQKFGGSACQLSPKAARRAQGSSYRYLTIDTSYGGGDSSSSGVEQPKGMDLLAEEEHEQQQHKHSKLGGHWDTGSLSSGISSGDLSSPCGDCHPQESSPVMACKDVHVQDVVRRHNSNAANAKARAKFASRRTWCMGGAGAASDSLYRQIYEQNLGHAEDCPEDEQQEEEDHYDEEEDEQQSEEQDMCENYYVSNDILAKIRECGSTVTYYGGRVLDNATSKMPLPQAGAAAAAAAQQMNGTRSRIRQIEACNVCLPSDRCEHRLQTKQSLEEQEQQSQDSYQGIKFKLVKSNSCSSRLELAGADMEVTADSEVVRKMVHHFEATATDPVTINSQSHSQSQLTEAAAPPRRLPVTVNNHINVQAQRSEILNGGGSHAAENEISHPTYESQAMNIRLDVPRGSSNGNASNVSKVCRNKNVDLAYTLVKQPTAGGGTPQGRAGATHEGNQWLPQGQKMPQTEEVAVSKVGSKQQTTTTTTAAAINGSGRPQMIVPVEIHQQIQQVAGPAAAPERRLSNASSSAASVVDKTVVRHYVANDRSIYERRKYDEIEFEEFEVYDPSKEVEQPQEQDKPPTDAELYDSLDDKM